MNSIYDNGAIMLGNVKMISISKLDELLDDLLQECENDLFEYEDIKEEKAKMIYSNVNLFVLKLKDKLIDYELVKGDE